jgi:peptide/nickel transport system permease protein
LVATFFMGAYSLIFIAIPWKSLGEGNFASVIKLILIIVFFGWMTVARLARASAMQLKNMEFVVAAHALGASHARTLLSHIFPNALAPIIVAATLEVGGNILYEAALSFLGLGVQPPVSSWGNMLNNAVEYIKSSPSLAFWPGLFILITVACFNFLGDGMRDALDPHQVMKSAKGKT